MIRFCRKNLILLAILSIAATARYWGINFGLPHISCRPDEDIIVNIAFFFGSGDFNPHSFAYPSFYMYILFGFYAMYFMLGIVTGNYVSSFDLISEYSIDPSNFYLINRLLVVFFGVLTIYILYKITESLFNRKTAIITSLFLSLAYLHVRDSHFGTLDVPVSLLIICSTMYILRSYKNKNFKNYILAGIFAGLATSTKFIGVILLIPMLIAHFFNISDEKDKFIKLFFDKRILFFVIALVTLFILGTPFLLLDFRKFMEDLYFTVNLSTSDSDYPLLGNGWWYHLKFTLFYGLGWPLFFSSLAGIFVFIKQKRKEAIIFFAFPFSYYLFVGSFSVVFLRYMVPLVPFFCVAAAFFIVYIENRFFKHFKRNTRIALISTLVFLIIVPPVKNILKFNQILTRTDNRLIAAEWINKNIKTGSSIYQPYWPWGKPQLSPTVNVWEKMYERSIAEGRQGRILKAKIDYMRKENIPGYEQWTYNEKTNKFNFKGETKNILPKYIIIEKSPLVMYTRIPEAIKKPLETSYRLKKSFMAININNKKNLFDQQDAFYVPFAGFKGVKRPGPNIYIYKRI